MRQDARWPGSSSELLDRSSNFNMEGTVACSHQDGTVWIQCEFSISRCDAAQNYLIVLELSQRHHDEQT